MPSSNIPWLSSGKRKGLPTRRRLYAGGLVFGRRIRRAIRAGEFKGRPSALNTLDRPRAVFPGSIAAAAGYRAGITGHARKSRVGSFKRRKGQWAKGEGGRFIGTA